MSVDVAESAQRDPGREDMSDHREQIDYWNGEAGNTWV